MDYKLELVLIPVSDVDRAKEFYTEKAGFDLLVDTIVGDAMRIVQVTPPGSSCSIGFGSGLGLAAPAGSYRGLHLAVTDIVAARDELIGRGVEAGDIRYMEDGEWKPGPDPQHRSYASFSEFTDPDGNLFLLQEIRRGANGAPL
ncbi:MAG: VOC family protein [Streptosporangiaceae bacterium]|nr:VOC family protein [Streptosporangiaceae bacterium]